MPTLPESPITVTLNDNWIRLLVWVVCDGTMVDSRKYDGPDSVKRRIQFKLSYQKKIDALQDLLTTMGIRYTFRPATMSGGNVLQPYYIRIYGSWGRAIFEALPGKRFPSWFEDLTIEQFRVFLSELEITDGQRRWHHIWWITTCQADSELVQRLCKRHGYTFKLYHDDATKSGFANGKPQYRLNIALPGARAYKKAA